MPLHTHTTSYLDSGRTHRTRNSQLSPADPCPGGCKIWGWGGCEGKKSHYIPSASGDKRKEIKKETLRKAGKAAAIAKNCIKNNCKATGRGLDVLSPGIRVPASVLPSMNCVWLKRTKDEDEDEDETSSAFFFSLAGQDISSILLQLRRRRVLVLPMPRGKANARAKNQPSAGFALLYKKYI